MSASLAYVVWLNWLKGQRGRLSAGWTGVCVPRWIKSTRTTSATFSDCSAGTKITEFPAVPGITWTDDPHNLKQWQVFNTIHCHSHVGGLPDWYLVSKS